MDGRELGQFVTDLIWYLRNLLLLKSAEHMEDVLDISTEQLERLKQESQSIDENILMRYIHILSELLGEMAGASQKRALLEVALIRLMKPQTDEDYTAVIDRLVSLEQRVESGVVAVAQPAQAGEKPPVQRVEREPFPEETEETVKRAAASWNGIAASAPGLMGRMLSVAYVSVSEDGRSLLLVFDKSDKTQAGVYKQLRQQEKTDELGSLIEEYCGARVPIQFVLNDSELDRSHRFTDAVTRFEQDTGIKIEEEDF